MPESTVRLQIIKMEKIKTLNDIVGKKLRPKEHSLISDFELRKEAIKLYKILEKVPYGKNFCLECGKMNKGQYCHEKKNHDSTLHSETGDISALQSYLKWFYKITKGDLK